jgi:hypothetical protein
MKSILFQIKNYRNIRKFESRVLSTDKNLRPNSEQILESRDDWSISHKNFNDEFSPNHIIIECLKLESKEKPFCCKFIEQKVKNFNWGKYNKIKEYMFNRIDTKTMSIFFVEYLMDSKFSCGPEKYRKKFEEKNLIAIETIGIVCKAI